MTARLAHDVSFAAELKARQTRAPRPLAPVEPDSGGSGPEATSGGDEAASEAEPPADDGAPEWPDEETEGAMLAEVQDREAALVPVVSRRAARAEAAGEAEELPQLDDAVRQVPAAVRQTLDELFRAQFVQVRRVPTAVLKAYEAD